MGKPPPGGEGVKTAIGQLSQLTDLIGLEVYISKHTPRGKSTHPDRWGHTREALATYSPNTDPEQVIQLFEQQGVSSDVEAARWIIRHDKLIP